MTTLVQTQTIVLQKSIACRVVVVAIVVILITAAMFVIMHYSPLPVQNMYEDKLKQELNRLAVELKELGHPTVSQILRLQERIALYNRLWGLEYLKQKFDVDLDRLSLFLEQQLEQDVRAVTYS